MNPTLDRQLARLRTRFAKTPLPGFFAWWGTQLLACMPVRWRTVLAERSEALVLDLRSDEIVVWRERGEVMSEYARIRRDLAPGVELFGGVAPMECVEDGGRRQWSHGGTRW